MRPMTRYKKYLPHLVLTIMSVLLWAAWYTSYPYFLRWLEGYSFFSTLPDFTHVHYDLPADILKYVGAFLLQFYSSPAAASLIQTAMTLVFVSCIWGCVRRIFADPESLIWIPVLPIPVFIYYQLSDLTLSRTLTWVMISVIVLISVILLTIKKRNCVSFPGFLRNLYVALILSAGAVAASAALLIKGNDLTRGYEEVARLEYFAEHQQWNKILEVVSRQESVNNEYKRKYVLLALLNTGKLTEHAFTYGLSDSDDFLFADVQEPFCLGFNVLFYNSLDMFNAAIYNTYQSSVQSTPGMSFDSMRYLADVYLKLGDYDLAKKYLDILNSSTCHGKWVKERLPKLASLKGAEPSYPQSGPIFTLESFLTDISSMYDRYPHDRRYADLMLCGILAEKDGNAFYNVFQIISRNLYPEGRDIPALYQEALLLAASQNPEILNRYRIDEQVWKRFADFTDLMQKGRTAEAKRKYAGTYWAYVY